MDISDFYGTFFEEADELLADMESCLLNLDIDDPDPEHVNAIFRAAHSIKGGAGTFGFDLLQQTTHILENLLDKARMDELTLTKSIIDIFLETKDVLSDQIDAYRSETTPDEDVFNHIVERLKSVGQAAEGAEPAPESAPEEPSIEEPTEEDEPVLEEPAPVVNSSASGVPELIVSFINVKQDDIDSLVEELGHLGDVLSKGGDEKHYEVVMETNVSVDDIEAVMCFIIEPEQVQIRHADPSAEEGSAESTELNATVDNLSEEQKAAIEGVEIFAQTEEEVAPSSEASPEIIAETTPVTSPEPAAKAPKTNTPAKSDACKKPAPAKKPRKAADAESASIRVAVDKVDQVINLVGELIITQSMLNETANSLDNVIHSSLQNGINLLQRNARDLQDAVMSIRMLPMDYVFSRYPRLVRDLASKMGKEINLVTVGESTELDKGLTEKIIDPLTHLVRNSLDHGIEKPEDRVAKGKPREGTLTLSAQHQGGNILIEVTDDGAGLNRAKILDKARSKGITVSDNMPDEEVWLLIFAPGFSTADTVSDVSGRGVGMDVVKRNIQAMGGYVEIHSKEGEGTTTRIYLPLTLAILDGMLVNVGSEVYIIPVSSVIESLQIRAETLHTVSGGIPLLKVRGEYFPIVKVGEVMGVPGANQEVEGSIAVMVDGGGRKYALMVDGLVGQQQVVVKNLESNYKKVAGVSAATILGDGSVALILDMGEVYRTYTDGGETRTTPGDVDVNEAETA